jgi:spermidine synthase
MSARERAAPRLYLETFLIALAVILLEVNYTRVFSFKLFYYFTYLIIGIALLGLGAGGVLVAISARLRGCAVAYLIPFCCLGAAAAVLMGYFVIAYVQLNAFELVDGVVPFQPGVVVREGAKLLAICAVLFLPFLATGVALSTIFATRAERFHGLYFADLLGAGLGCAIAVPVMSLGSPPGGVVLAGLLFALAAGPLAATHARLLLVPAVPLGTALVVLALSPGLLPEPVPDTVKDLSPQQRPQHPLPFSRWTPVFRVDVVPRPSQRLPGYMIAHDGLLGSFLPQWSGDLAALVHFDTDSRSHPFRILPPNPAVAIIGAAGGHEILASLYFGARHVTAVELNPVTVSLLTTHYADYTGRMAEHPAVTLVNGEGRSFLRRTRDRYDLIWFVAPDSYAAMNAATAGAFVLSESYLYTREAILESLAHLTDDGIVCVQFGEVHLNEKPIRTARYLATARDAFRQLGVADFHRHVLVGTSFSFIPLSTILIKRTPFTGEEAQRFTANTARLREGRVRHALETSPRFDPISAVITLQEPSLHDWAARYPYHIEPVTDDSPFFWHFVSFRDALSGGSKIKGRSFEEATGERLLVLLLAVAAAFAALFLLLPFAAIGEVWRTIPYKTSAGIYFAALGVGFMLFEVSLIQMLTLFLGYPTYSLTVTLFALLISTGVGSLLSGYYRSRRNAVMAVLLCGLLALVLFYRSGLPLLVDRFVGEPLAVRVALTVACLVPLGLCLGAFMPLGLRTIGGLTAHREEFVAWAWAVNGFFSVMSSVLATMLSMVIGFGGVLLIGFAIYVLGASALSRLPEVA